jgi:hypothetical protein
MECHVRTRETQKAAVASGLYLLSSGFLMSRNAEKRNIGVLRFKYNATSEIRPHR